MRYGLSSLFQVSMAIAMMAAGGILAPDDAGTGKAEENSPIFMIQLPEANITASVTPLISIESSDISVVIVYILKPEADDIGYGDIYPFVNGAAAAMVSEIKASDMGKKVRIDLHRRPGFRMLPGFNTVGVRALDNNAKEYRATFVVHIPKGECNLGRARLLTVDDLGELLRVGVSNVRITQLVLDCGVSFLVNPFIKDKLRAEGAQEELIRTIEDPLKAEQQGLGSKGLNIEELLNLLEERTPSEELLELIRTRGVNFTLDQATEAELRRAGATEALVQAIRTSASSM
jgi:hypothetical protein